MSERIKQFLRDCNGEELTETEYELLSQLNDIRLDLNVIREKAIDDYDWRDAVTTALVGPGSDEISRGRALEIIAELKKGRNK